MKLAIVIEQFRPGGGGNERSTEQIARRLTARGHAVTLLTNAAPDDAAEWLGCPIEVAGGPKNSTANGLARFMRWAEGRLDAYDASLAVTLSVPATIVQPRGGTYRETLAANIRRRRTSVGRALRAAGALLSPKQRAMLWAERRTLRHPRVRRIAAISHYVADQLSVHYGVPAERIALIPNAASVTRMPDAERDAVRRGLRDQLQFTDEDVVCLFAAMNPDLKGLGPLLEAFSRLDGPGRRAKLVVAGSARVPDIHRAETLGIADRVRWLGPTSRIDALYAAGDLTVLPTFYDPASKVVIESLLHGRPAISTRCNGASQWIADPSAGRINTSPLARRSEAAAEPSTTPQPAGRVIDHPRAIEQLAGAITALCDDRELARCAAATADLDARLNMDEHTAALERLIIEAVPGRAAANRSQATPDSPPASGPV